MERQKRAKTFFKKFNEYAHACLHARGYLYVYVGAYMCVGAYVWGPDTISDVRPQETSTSVSQGLSLAWGLLIKPGWPMSLSLSPHTAMTTMHHHDVLCCPVGPRNQAEVITLGHQALY